MELTVITQVAGTVIATLGGGAVVVAAFSGWLGKVWAEHLMQSATQGHEKELERIRDEYRADLEKLRIRLKKSEFIFEKEFAAASTLVEYHEQIIPLSQFANMHMDDVYVSIAHDFDEIEEWVKKFVAAHGAVLPDRVAKELMMAARTAGQFKFRVGQGLDEAVDTQTFNAAEDVYHRIRAARDAMRDRVWEQSST